MQLASGRSKVGAARSNSAVDRPLHQIVAAAVVLKYLEMLPSLLDRLIDEAPHLFVSDRLITMREADLATLVYVAYRVPVSLDIV